MSFRAARGFARRSLLVYLSLLATLLQLCYLLRMPSESVRLNVNPHIECAETLASRFYTDPAVLTREKTRIFLRTWQFVGTLSQPCGESNGTKRTIADPETYFTSDITGEPVVIVRDKTRTLRAFSNVCRHRAGCTRVSWR